MTEQSQSQRKLDPHTVLEQIRSQIQLLTGEYSSGNLNPAQFNAIYRHYTEKRFIIEKLLERNPDSDVWRTAATSGTTSYLRERYESRVMYYAVFRHGDRQPLTSEGKLTSKAAQQLHQMLKIVWVMKTKRSGLARKSLGEGMWLLLMMGELSMTLVVYFLQPSITQVDHIRDLHNDFERANNRLLERGASTDRMVFPQRALMDK